MRAWLRNRLGLPTPAMLVAFLALLAALAGTAWAATNMINIADPITPANKARVDAGGALKTTGSVSGFIGETAPKTPFFGQRYVSPSANETLIGANKATVALTRLSVDNYFDNVGTVRLGVGQRGGDASTCNGSSGFRDIGSYNVPVGQTFSDSMESPIVLKPLSSGTVWCLIASTSIKGSPSSFYLPGLSWSGYIVSGTLPAGAMRTGARTGDPSNLAVPPRETK